MKQALKRKSRGAIRLSITFPENVYEALQLLATQKKVSVAWVVRDAAERYVADQWPLLDAINKPRNSQ
jgi:hypothetical protein